MEEVEFKRKVLDLLKKDEEFRYAVAGLLGLEEILRRLDAHQAEMARLREDMVKGFERHDAEIAELRREMARLREDMVKGFELVERHISALGVRWGLLSEEAFRQGLRGILGKEFDLEVERWEFFDEEGFVYGYPSPVEIDVAVRDERILLVEIAAHARASDVYTFKRKADLYRKVTGRSPSRLILVTPYADESAVRASKKLGIEIYTKV
ncbi:MAG TPA: DUF3782 domain-containing protein [Candidatus Korarchaeota archaeon]|nr:DUF3782 domain-containing protein [Candidatus Korarchaeota archaeon]